MNTKIKKIKYVVVVLMLSITSLYQTVSAQKQVYYSSDWGEKLPSFPNQLILKSNVVFVHENMTMTCDSAIFNTEENLINAYNNIHGNDFVLNNKGYRLPQTISDISLKIQSLFPKPGKGKETPPFFTKGGEERDYPSLRIIPMGVC